MRWPYVGNLDVAFHHSKEAIVLNNFWNFVFCDKTLWCRWFPGITEGFQDVVSSNLALTSTFPFFDDSIFPASLSRSTFWWSCRSWPVVLGTISALWLSLPSTIFSMPVIFVKLIHGGFCASNPYTGYGPILFSLAIFSLCWIRRPCVLLKYSTQSYIRAYLSLFNLSSKRRRTKDPVGMSWSMAHR